VEGNAEVQSVSKAFPFVVVDESTGQSGEVSVTIDANIRGLTGRLRGDG
jgi:hypothetical protein